MNFPREAAVFLAKSTSAIGELVVEVVGYGRATRADEDASERGRPFIRAQAVWPDGSHDQSMWWYYTAADLIPLSACADKFHRALIQDERHWQESRK